MTRVHANPGRTQRTKPAGTQPSCPTGPPNSEENRVLLPSTTPLTRRDLLPLRTILGDATRVNWVPGRWASDHCEVGLFAKRVWLQARPWANRARPPCVWAGGSERRRERRLSFGRLSSALAPVSEDRRSPSISTAPRNYTAAGRKWVSARCYYTARKCTSAPRRWRRHPRRCERALAT